MTPRVRATPATVPYVPCDSDPVWVDGNYYHASAVSPVQRVLAVARAEVLAASRRGTAVRP